MQIVHEQINRIIDTGEGDRREVIVRLGARDEREKELVRLAVAGITERRMSISARDFLPLRKGKVHRTSAPQDQEFPRDTRGVSSHLSRKAKGAVDLGR